MYYRYKSKQKSKKRYKFILIISIILCIGYLGYKNKDKLLFWKYDFNKVKLFLKQVKHENNNKKKIELLNKLQNICNDYKKEHPLDFEAYYLSARVNFLIGENLLEDKFSNMIIKNEFNRIPLKTEKYLIKTIKDVKKGIALDKRSRPKDNILIIFAKANYYLKYYESNIIFKWLEKIREPKLLENIDDRRFYGILKLLNGQVDSGISFLENYAAIKNEEGKLFIAAAYEMAKQYTKAIMEYKSQLQTTADSQKIKMIHFNLGKIYQKQSLLQEALQHYRSAYNEDVSDNLLKLYIAKVYLKLGDKRKAKYYLYNILSADKENLQAKELLKAM